MHYGKEVILIKGDAMATSKLTSKFQTTIPQEVRSVLDLKAGDHILFEVTAEKQVKIKKATALDLLYLKSLESTLDEWSSQNDEEDFRDL